MRIPFSYKQHFFGTMLTLSVLGHAVLLSGGLPYSNQPSFSVQQAKSSLEILLIKEVKKEKTPTIEKFLTTKRETAAPPVVQEIKEKPEPTKELPQEASAKAQGALMPAKPLRHKNLAPNYPALAKRRGWEGVVLLQVTVNTEGQVEQLTLAKSSGHRILDQAAMKALKRWRFEPARMGPIAYKSEIEIPIRFILED